ncbi:mechanosensitive ion channel family protein [Parasedimentitalea marina]|uniref:Mechanosensitive ion channel family protein n=2 Tax=Parasedimentitalea marina TaxID=2483033 RepID=A0A3T0N387_9RHOB|nr:mechanosensitive ion channel family protein [Parasedimentitalea marina]
MSQSMQLLRFALTVLCFALWGTGGADAQLSATERNYYQGWLNTAERAELVIDQDRASSASLEVLRREIADHREVFASARDNNADRIGTLNSQLSALGPAPGEGEIEDGDLAALRSSLNDQLTALRVPRVVSEEAHNRANGLISEIDRIIRKRQTKALMQRGPSPVNPENWAEALREISAAVMGLWNETLLQVQSDTTRENLQNRLPVILGLILAGGLLVLRGRSWTSQVGTYLRQVGIRDTGVWSFLVSLVQVLLPLLGVIFLTQAISMSGILGVRGALILESVPGWALILLAFNWLGQQVLASPNRTALLPVQNRPRRELRLLVVLIAVMLVLRDLIIQIDQLEYLSDVTRSVVAFPIILTTALLLFRVQRLGLKRLQETTEQNETVGVAGANKLVRAVRRAVYMLAGLAPILAVFGYIHASEAIIYPVAVTLFVISTTLVIQRVLGAIYALVTRNPEAAQDSLFSVLVGFVLAILVMPVLALIWGARIADLTELWSRFMDGVQFGDTRISPSSFLMFALVFAAGYVATRMVQSSLRNSLLPKTKLDPGGQNAIVSGTGYLGIFLAAVVAISWAGLDLSSLAIVAGALSVGIGFGLQTVVSNFVSGIILLVERPISKGDWIEVGGMMGYVRDISVRSTRIETFDRTDVIIPNSDLITGAVTNFTRGNTVGRVIVPVGVAYGTDPRRVEKILLDIAQAHPMVLLNPAPSVVFQGFGADSLDFEIRAILRDVNWALSVRSDLNFEISRRFTEEDIEIPFAQRDLWIRNPEVLTPNSTTQDLHEPTPALVHPDLSDLDAPEGDNEN